MKFKDLILQVGKKIDHDSNDSKDMQEILRLICSTCNAQISTILNWFAGDTFPSGAQLIKFRETFIAAGYLFDEAINSPPVLSLMAALIGQGVLDVKKHYELLGFPSRDEFVRPLTTDRPLHKKRSETIGLILRKNYSKEIAALPEMRKKFAVLRTLKSDDMVMAVESVEEIKTDLTEILRLKEQTALKIKGLISGPSAEREKFRKLYQEGDFFRLSNDLYNFSALVDCLCSESALENFKNKNKGKNS